MRKDLQVERPDHLEAWVESLEQGDLKLETARQVGFKGSSGIKVMTAQQSCHAQKLNVVEVRKVKMGGTGVLLPKRSNSVPSLFQFRILSWVGLAVVLLVQPTCCNASPGQGEMYSS